MSVQGAPSPLAAPSLSRRMASSVIMGLTSLLSKAFLYGANNTETVGLQGFKQLLDSRRDPAKRQRGLITVSNHVSVMDDPLMWGVLPLKYAFEPTSLRWGLGAYDICFKNKLLSAFFFTGQVLPTHRTQHSPHGGLFQPSMSQAIRLLSSQPYSLPLSASLSASSSSVTTLTSTIRETYSSPPEAVGESSTEPFTSGTLTYSTNSGVDSFPAPSAYASNANSWVHIFPEGCVHQHRERGLRYFKWGVARLVLESQPAPDVVPIFIDGPDRIMPEDRGFPRFLPRAGRPVRVVFGDRLDFEATFGDLRRRWEALVATTAAADNPGAEQGKETKAGMLLTTTAVTMKTPIGPVVGELPDELKYGPEAQEIRVEVAMRMRDEMLKLRRSLGYPDEDPSHGLAETWAREPAAKKYKSKVDGSLVNQD